MRESCVQEGPCANDDRRQNPIADTGHVFRELIWRRNTDPRKDQKRHRDAKVRRVEKVASATTERSAQDGLRGDRNHGGEDNWSKSLVCVKEHGASETRNVCRE